MAPKRSSYCSSFAAALDWNIGRVQKWALEEIGVSKKCAEILATEEIDGVALANTTYEKFREYGVSGGAATKLFEGVKTLFPERFAPPPLPPALPIGIRSNSSRLSNLHLIYFHIVPDESSVKK